MPAATPETEYARRGDAHIAHQVVGDAELDLVLVSTWFSHVEARWDIPGFAQNLDRLLAFARVISFDEYGIGLSGPILTRTVAPIEDWVADVRAVMDAVGAFAVALREAVRPLALVLRTGIHGEEIERVAGGDVAGLAVHAAARIQAAAEPGQILVSRTVKDLAVGAGVRFEDAGLWSLKRIPDEWRLSAPAASGVRVRAAPSGRRRSSPRTRRRPGSARP